MSRSIPTATMQDNKAGLINSLLKDKNGKEAKIISLEQEKEDASVLLLLEDGQAVRASLSSLDIREAGGAMQSPHAFDEFDFVRQMETLVVPVVQEELSIAKRVVDTGKGMRIVKKVHEHDEKIILPLVQESLSVEHVDIGRLVSADDLPIARQEGDTYIVPVLEEVLVVEKKIYLKKEVRITRTKKEVPKAEKIRVRREEVLVEPFNEQDVHEN